VSGKVNAMVKKFWTILIFLNFITPSAFAIMGGEKASGDPKVVALIHWSESNRQGCSGALIAPRIVLTAAHCMSRMPKDGVWRRSTYTYLPVSGPLSEKTPMWVALPGLDVSSNVTKTAKVIAQYGPEYYEDSFYDYNGSNNHGSLYDFAVLVLDRPLSALTFRVATMEETLSLISSESEALALGYGASSYGGYLDPSPMKSKTQIRSKFLWQGAEANGILESKPYYKLGMIVQTNLPDNVFHGGGDSGSPLWTNINGEWVYVGALSSAQGPTANLSSTDKMWSGQFWLDNAGGQYYTAWAFESLITDANKFLSIQVLAEQKIASQTIPYKNQKNGQACKKTEINKSVKTNDSKTLICTKVGSKSIWKTKSKQ
jgi:hypothetical protein